MPEQSEVCLQSVVQQVTLSICCVPHTLSTEALTVTETENRVLALGENSESRREVKY